MNEDPGTGQYRDPQANHDHDVNTTPCHPGCPSYEAMLLEKRRAMATGPTRPPGTSALNPDTGEWEPAVPLGWQGVSGKIEGWLRAHPRIPGAVRVANALGRWEERGLG